MKALIFDSSSIITLALNNLLFILEPLKKAFNGEFFIPEKVEYELIDKSLKTKRFRLEAYMIQKLINQGILKLKTNGKIKEETGKLLNIANNTFKVEYEGMRIIHAGEAECLTLFNSLATEDKAIVIDERTTRMLCEKPQNLHRLLEKKHHTKILANEVNYKFFRKFKIIRSSELAYIAYKKGIIKLPSTHKEAIDAIFYALKFKGCSISHGEISIAKNL
jgi:hypothetical protein